MASLARRSVVIGGHKTSVSLEDEFWQALKNIAAEREKTLTNLVSVIDKHHRQGNLSSTIRLFVLQYYLDRANPAANAKDASPEIGTVRLLG
jgi:predicted DNA-binding ribbon-helix-helix protein